MYYAPHILQKRCTGKERNKYGELVSKSDCWCSLAACRCDDNAFEHFETDNGKAYTPKYHIVCIRVDVKPGDYIRAISDDGTVRGEGRVYNVNRNNLLNYMNIYV